MKQKYGEGLIGLKVRLFTNGDISCIDRPNANIGRCFGPTCGSQHEVYGNIVDFNIDFNSLGVYNRETDCWTRETKVRIWIEYNDDGRFGLHTSGWDFTLDQFKEYIAYIKVTVKQEGE